MSSNAFARVSNRPFVSAARTGPPWTIPESRRSEPDDQWRPPHKSNDAICRLFMLAKFRILDHKKPD